VAQNSMNVQKAFRQLATLFSDPDAQPINRWPALSYPAQMVIGFIKKI
jgi:hypothetical protein